MGTASPQHLHAHIKVTLREREYTYLNHSRIRSLLCSIFTVPYNLFLIVASFEASSPILFYLIIIYCFSFSRKSQLVLLLHLNSQGNHTLAARIPECQTRRYPVPTIYTILLRLQQRFLLFSMLSKTSFFYTSLSVIEHGHGLFSLWLVSVSWI